jgi:two-component system, NtrC family, response regulator HydG
MPPKPRILLVDDEETLVTLNKKLLELYDFDVVPATSGNEALAILKKSTFDAVVTDIKMPDGDGVYLLEEITKMNINPIVFLVTGYSDFTPKEIQDKGAHGLFRKPLDIETLVEKINHELK